MPQFSRRWSCVWLELCVLKISDSPMCQPVLKPIKRCTRGPLLSLVM
uniref:Uncharacterized protein n=1 Tax=Anopheles funestus TaxID=62324 RepID=A0A182S0P8_ANOFN